MKSMGRKVIACVIICILIVSGFVGIDFNNVDDAQVKFIDEKVDDEPIILDLAIKKVKTNHGNEYHASDLFAEKVFPRDPLSSPYRLDQKDRIFKCGPIQIYGVKENTGSAPDVIIEDNVIQYQSLLDGIDYSITNYVLSTKETLILKTRDALGEGDLVLTWPISIPDYHVRLRINGETVTPGTGAEKRMFSYDPIEFLDISGTTVSMVYPPYVFDSSIDDVSYLYPGYNVEINGMKMVLRMVIPCDFLQDRNVQYPLTIDPTWGSPPITSLEGTVENPETLYVNNNMILGPTDSLTLDNVDVIMKGV